MGYGHRREGERCGICLAKSHWQLSRAEHALATAKARETWGGCIMNLLVVDVGGTHVKVIATGQNAAREFPSGPTLTAEQMVAGVKKLTADWTYDAVTIGYPGPVLNNRPLTDPWNLG